jgi:GntR family transcriptional regulator, arabinose operon transcriptional repressor
MESPLTNSQHHTHKLHRQVEALIRQSIIKKSLKPGDQLPTEADLCQQFHVSRSTVRLALMQLERAGLITRTPGRGTFVRQVVPPPEPVSELPIALHRHEARGTRMIRSAAWHTVGVVMSFAGHDDVLNVMQINILLGIEHAIKSRGYKTLFVRTDEFDEQGEARAIDELKNAGMGGIIILPIANHTSTIGVRTLVELQKPLVLIDRYLSEQDTSYVVSDNFKGAYCLTQHLIVLGYTTFEYVLPLGVGTLTEQLATTTIRDRYAGYCQALQDYGLACQVKPACLVDMNDPAAVRSLLTSPRDRFGLPVAIVALHDLVAIPIINSAAKAGLRPPEDFAIVGFDDLPFAAHLSVPLTTVTQPRYEIGFNAGHLLVDKIEGNPIRNDKLSLMVSLVVRETCGAHCLIQQRRSMSIH